MRNNFHFPSHQRGLLILVCVSIILYVLPARCSQTITGRVASATANVTALFLPENEKEAAGTLVEHLSKELALARQELAACRNELHILGKELESISGIASSNLPLARMIPARVVLRRDASNFRRTILVNAGSLHGVRPGLPVLWGRVNSSDTAIHACLVGMVDTVGPRASRVLLVSDAGLRIPAVMLESREKVIVEGCTSGSYPMRVRRLSSRAALKRADMVVTSGTLGIFPQGILIGMVAQVQTPEFAPEMEVRLSCPVNLDDLEAVTIVELAAAQPQGEDR